MLLSERQTRRAWVSLPCSVLGGNRPQLTGPVFCFQRSEMDKVELSLESPQAIRVGKHQGEERARTRSPHPFITRITLPCSFLFPLLISPLLLLLLGTPLSPVFELFLIHLLLVW